MIEDKLNRYARYCAHQRDGGTGWSSVNTVYQLMKYCLHIKSSQTPSNHVHAPATKKTYRESLPDIPFEFQVLEDGIQRLCPAQKKIIQEKYFNVGHKLKDRDKIERLGITKDTFYYHLNAAHQSLKLYYDGLDEIEYILRTQ